MVPFEPPAVTRSTLRSLLNPTVYSIPPLALVPVSSKVRLVSPVANFTVVCLAASSATSFSLVALATSLRVAVFPSVSLMAYVFVYPSADVIGVTTPFTNVVFFAEMPFSSMVTFSPAFATSLLLSIARPLP